MSPLRINLSGSIGLLRCHRWKLSGSNSFIRLINNRPNDGEIAHHLKDLMS